MTNNQFNQSQEGLESRINSIVQSVKAASFTENLKEAVIDAGTKAISASRALRQEVIEAFFHPAPPAMPEYDHVAENRDNVRIIRAPKMQALLIELNTKMRDLVEQASREMNFGEIINESTYEKLLKTEGFDENRKKLADSTAAIQKALLDYVHPAEEKPPVAEAPDNGPAISPSKPVEPMEHVITAADLANNPDLKDAGVKEGEKVMLAGVEGPKPPQEGQPEEPTVPQDNEAVKAPENPSSPEAPATEAK